MDHEIVCPHCTAVNRIAAGKPMKEAKCGKCHQALFDGHPTVLEASTFEKHISRTTIPVVVDFWAEWCGPCKMMAPEFARAAENLEPAVRLAKLDTEAAQDIATRHGIRSIPTMIVFQGGREVARQAGAMPAGHIIQWVRETVRG
jgi:thioredoxin 2